MKEGKPRPALPGLRSAREKSRYADALKSAYAMNPSCRRRGRQAPFGSTRTCRSGRSVPGGDIHMGSRGQPEPQRRDWEMLSRRRLAERKQRRPQAPLRLGCQRTEPLVCLHYVRVREASACEFFWQSFIRLPRIGRKAKRDPAPTFHHPSHFLQSGHGVGPDLHRVDRHHLVKAVVIEWQTLNGTMPQVDTTAMDSGGVPSPSLFDHLQRLIDAGAMPPLPPASTDVE
jgi:hypothetical protein